jgi:predicted RNA-binding protein YlqC (UPF0109 family)
MVNPKRCVLMSQATQMAAGDPAKNMTDLVKEIARALVDNPENVSVEALQDGEGTVLRLRVASSDVGKVIGKQGRTARSLRTILSAASMKQRHRFSLDILEGGNPSAQE